MTVFVHKLAFVAVLAALADSGHAQRMTCPVNHPVSLGSDGSRVAWSPTQRWLTRFDGCGFTVCPEAGGWTWGLEFKRYGFSGSEIDLPTTAIARHAGQRVEYDWNPEIQEWFLNDARGIEQGWTIRSRPPGAAGGGPLRLFLSVRGALTATVSADSGDSRFLDEHGVSVIDFGGLKAWDADGCALPVRFEVPASGHGDLAIALEEGGARYPITVDPVAQQAYFKASNPERLDRFGWTASICGPTLAIGAPHEDSSAIGINGNQGDNSLLDSGAVYVFARDGTGWAQQAYVKASNPGTEDYFGWSVAVCGDTLVVGAGYEDSGATGVNGNQGDNSADRAGAAYVFVREGSTWSQQAYLKPANTLADHRFGWSLAISGDTLVVGATGDRSNATGVNGDDANSDAPYSGAAYVFVREGSAWSQQAYLKASNTEQYDLFGCQVAISGDTIVVGAQEEDGAASGVNGDQHTDPAYEAGAAYVFVREGSTWSQQAYLKASNTDPGDSFGAAVAISGDTVAVGAGGERSNATGVNGNQSDNSLDYAGAVYLFVRDGTTWSQQAYLKASNTQAEDMFARVAIAGDTLVVSADAEDSAATGIDGDENDNTQTEAGAAYVFTRLGTLWTQLAYLKPSNTPRCRYFGGGGSPIVAMSSGAILIGSYAENSAAAGVNGDQYTVASVYNAGAAYLFSAGAAEIAVEQPPGTSVADGAARDFGMRRPGETGSLSFTISNPGVLDLTGLAVTVDGSHAAEFPLTSNPMAPLAPGASTTFSVTFQPANTGSKTAVLHIASNDADENPFDITLSGLCLALDDDTDDDGLNDVAEFEMAALGFRWQVADDELVNTYFSAAHLSGLYSQDDLRNVHVGAPWVDVTNGTVTIELQLHKSEDLRIWEPFGDPVQWSEPAGGKKFYRLFFDHAP
jgi:hypothetical protein